MRNMLAAGMARLNQLQRAHASSYVTYRRRVGGPALRVPGSLGKSDAVTLNDGQAAVDATMEDVLISVSDLALNGVRFEPEGGDRITFDDGRTFEAAATPGNPPWQHILQGLRYRIHVHAVAP